MSMLACVILLLLLIFGTLFAAILDTAIPAWIAGQSGANPLTTPFRRCAQFLAVQRLTTERPDMLNWLLAPAAYLILAGIGLGVVPLSEGLVFIDLQTGLVLWGACEALTVVVVFLHGWSANAPFPLIGAYRYVAIGLPAMLVSMFVVIGVALPAQSLSVSAAVEAQRGLWNIVKQPLGLPLFMLLGLSLTLRGPFDYADPFDLAAGTSAEDSGPLRASWRFARLAMLVSFSTMAATLFLGGHHGPGLPGPLWLALKAAGVMTILVALGHVIARTTPSRMLTLLWVLFLPLSFLDLIIAGVESLP